MPKEFAMRKKYLWLGCVLAVAALVVGLIASRTRQAANQLPTASLQVTPDAGEAPLDVRLDGSASTDPDGTIVAYGWDFGDGQTGTGATVTHRYATPGTFTATLTVTDDRGGTHSAGKTVAVADPKSPVYPPMFGEIEPADGAVVRGADTWVRWSAPATKGQVQWRKAGETDFRTASTTDGDPLLARLAPLEVGGVYEYIVETRIGEETQRSGLRKFTAQAGLTFEPVAEQTVRRDYDQTITLTLKNTSAEKVVVAGKALVRFADLPADVVGPGSADQPAELAPGQSIALRLAVTAPDATRETYDIPVEAAGASTVAKVRIAPTKFKLSLKVVAEDPHTLARTVVVRNDGDPLTNLSIRVVDPNQRDVRLNPGVEHAVLGSGKALTLVTEPVLYLEFAELKTELECRAAGQSIRLPLEFVAPKGKRLIGLRGGTGTSTRGAGGFCTNNPITCSIVHGGPANGPARTSGAGNVDAGNRTRDWTPESRQDHFALAETQSDRQPRHNLMSGLRFGQDAFRPVFPHLRSQVAILAQAAGDENPKGEKSQSVPGTDGSARPGGCGDPRCCTDRDVAEFLQRAHDLQNAFWNALQRIDAMKLQIEKDQQRIPQLEISKDAQDLEQIVTLQANIEFFKERLKWWQNAADQAAWDYRKLQEECLKKCGIRLPGLGTRIPWSGTLDGRRERAKGLPPEDLKAMGLPPFFGDLSQDEQDNKLWAQHTAERVKSRGEMEDMYAKVIGLGDAGAVLAKNHGLAGNLSLLAGYFIVTGSLDEQIASGFDDIARDPPSPEYQNAVQPTLPAVAAPADPSDLQGLVWDSLVARRCASAYLKAWLQSYERYQGAKAAKDHAATRLQANAMVHFAECAVEAQRRAQLLAHEIKRRALPLVQEGVNVLTKGGAGWDEMLIQARQVIARNGLSPKCRTMLVAAGLSESKIAQIQRRPLVVSADDARLVVSRLKIEVEAMTGMPDPTRHLTSDPLPLPTPELIAMQHLQELSRRMRTVAQANGDATSSFSQEHLRPGLLEALQRRASFTRAHRGAFAAVLDGPIDDSSDTAAGWHAGDCVSFVWHQQDKIAFAAFDPRGEVLMEPQVIGKGCWPRITTDGKRTAVAWDRGDGSVVRVHDGEKWSDEVPLTGKEAAVAFVPGGPLHAATSTGLWKLAGKAFEPVQKAPYSQAALVIDARGRPHVASRKDGKIVYGDAVVDDGERPTLALAADGTLHLAYLSKGSIRVRSRKGEAWTEAETVPAKNPSWPTLAAGPDGVRLTYLGAAEKGPDALWLVRLPDKQPVLMPSLAGNVTDVYFLLGFGLKYARWYYRPHDVWVAVNDVVVGTFDNTIPEGRYLYKLNPYQVFTSTGSPVPNRVALHSWHMNGGNYALASEYQFVTRTAWSEWFAFAADEAGARKALMTRSGLNHDQPDLAVLANSLNLPAQPPKDGVTNFAVTVANVGESASAPAQLAMFSGERRLVSVSIPALKPGERNVAMLRLEGRVASVTFKLEQAKPDFDPTNDVLTLHLWEEGDPSLTKEPVARPGPGTTVGLDLRNWKQQGPKGNGNWVLSKDGKSVLQTINGEPTFYVSPDEYIDVTFRGTLTVEADSDDDYIGFVLGYKSPLGKEDDPLDFLLFDWKSLAQDNCKEGFTLARVKGKLAGEEGLWDRKETDRFKVLAKDYGDGKGWRYKKSYRFEVIYQKDRVRISVDSKPLFDVKGAFQSGRFGFYNYSQEGIRYSDFSVTQGEPAPAGGVPPREKK
jgi:PKD repeat protein